ncbi:MAG: hypothetical protein CMF75_10890 [Maricaulis sp.]|nr:hypothetical protein [Maricaulis sp.]
MAPGISTQIITVDQLTERQRSAWNVMRDSNFALSSPYFAPEFTEIIGAHRADTRILVVSRNGTLAGFLPLHLSRSGVARPIGGPLGDHHGFITDQPELDLDAALQSAGFGVFAFHGALADQTAFLRHCDGPPEISWVSDLSRGYDAFMAECAANDAKAMRNIRARLRKLDNLDADVVFRIDDRRPEALDALIAAKRDQYHRTKALDIFVAPWVQATILDLFETREPGLSGLLSTLEIDGKLAAGHFGMRSQNVLHYWFPVFWPEHANLGPGLSLYCEMAKALNQDGITQIHMGPGDYDFKRRLGNAGFGVVSGQAHRPSLTQAVVALGRSVDRMAQALPLGRASAWPGKAIRRLDKWASVHAL